MSAVAVVLLIVLLAMGAGGALLALAAVAGLITPREGERPDPDLAASLASPWRARVSAAPPPRPGGEDSLGEPSADGALAEAA